jgi:hypothetical protein
MYQYIGISCINKLESLFENCGCEDAVVVLANIRTVLPQSVFIHVMQVC